MAESKTADKPRPRHRLRRGVFAALFALTALYTATHLFSGEPGVGYFSSTEGRRAYLAAYEAAMAAMPAPTSVRDVATAWGTVRVYEWAGGERRAAPPVVLLPGHSSGAPMWQANLAGFSRRHTVYAFDALGDAGKSTQSVPLKDARDVAGWIGEALDGLGIERAHIVGHSFGGGYAANFAQARPERVQTLTLLEPAFALNAPPFSTLFWATVGSMEFLPEAWRNYGLAKLSGAEASEVASDDPLARMITAASAHHSASLPTPDTLTGEALAKLSMPVYVALAEKSAITGEKAAENAKRIPGATVRVWPNTTHSLPMEVPEELADDLNPFWAQNQ